MIVHSDSFFGVMFIFLVWLATCFALLASVVLLLALKFRLAAKVFILSAASLLLFWVVQGAAIALTPQTIVDRGDSFCEDIWCIGVTDVATTAQAENIVYKVGVHIFSDAGRGGKIHGKTTLFLLDDRGRRFPLLPDPSVTPFTRELAPQEGMDTTLTFQTPADAKRLYLTGEPTERRSLMVRLFTGDWLREHLAFMRKPTLLRVV
jgi:hypothetical protein